LGRTRFGFGAIEGQVKSNQLAFAVPGDLNTQTGGYIYDRNVIAGLRSQGRIVNHIELGGSFPNPSDRDSADAMVKLSALELNTPVIVDGLALGALEPEIVAGMSAPLIALVHHPLAHEGNLSDERRAFLFDTERQNLTHAKRVIVPSPHTKRLLVGEYGVPEEIITVARPGLERRSFLAKPQDPPLILSVGIQVPRKGHDVLFQALSKIGELPWQAVVVGGVLDAHYGRQLVELIEKLGLVDRVRIVGELSQDELANYYQQASVFALATRHEGYGMVFDEAMSYGLPIVSCDAGAVRETVAEGAGILTQVDDPDAFAHALRSLLLDEQLRLGMSTSAKAASLAIGGWDQTAKVVSEVIDSL
jgi:glycosyltransferase involved in cell wall biosynthesis